MMSKIHRPVLAGLLLSASLAVAQIGIGPITNSAEPANARAGHPDTRIAAGFKLNVLAQGSDPLENPSGTITQFGYLNDFPPQTVEATKTEPDQNLYLVLDSNPGGPTEGYDYGRHFLYQPHEGGKDMGSVTRINLDVQDPAHRITLLTPVGDDGLTHYNSLDGSAYDPFTKTLLFTSEASTNGGVLEITTGWPATVTTLDGILGKGGYEGIHPDPLGNLYIVEDVGGTKVNVDPNDPNSPKAARQPNSFVYRFIPYDKTNLSVGGKLQALQVTIDGEPVVFHADDPSGDVFSEAQLQLHTLGTSYPVTWVTVHDTSVNGFDSFDANAAAKAALATPFKRPENLAILPGSHFRTFFFDPTGDTNADSGNVPDLAARGAWGSIFRVDLNEDGNSGTLAIFVLGDADHSSFDNLSFANPRQLMAAEDRGDTLHSQLDKLDSVWAFSLDGSATQRFIALGRDTAAEVDAAFLDAGTPGYQNDGDNEPTGLYVSTGSTSVTGMLGTWKNMFGPRAFITQQHGLNTVYEIVRSH